MVDHPDIVETRNHMYCKRCGIMIIKNLNYRTDGYCLKCRIAIFDQQFENPSLWERLDKYSMSGYMWT